MLRPIRRFTRNSTDRPGALHHAIRDFSTHSYLSKPGQHNMLLTQLLGPEIAAPEGISRLFVTGLTADSRQVAPGFVFAALPGSSVDGARFIGDAAARGAVAVLAGIDTVLPDGLRVFVVRGFNLTGPGQEPPFVVPDFANQVARIAADTRFKPCLFRPPGGAVDSRAMTWLDAPGTAGSDEWTVTGENNSFRK